MSDLVWFLLLGACTSSDPGGTGGSESTETSTNGTSSTAAGDETSDGTASSSASSTSSGDGTGGTASTASAATDTENTASTTGESSTTSAVGCGNGVREDDEECDDGNDDDFDACTSQCTVPICNDGQHNGGESDVDCGGSCQACALCQSCVSGIDCGAGMVCGSTGECVTQYDVDIDWEDNCGTSANGVTIANLAAGSYRATATQSAGALWFPPYNPPTTGFFYLAECTGVSFEEMRTPQGIRYANVATAYANMISETEVFDHAGGDFTCWIGDLSCGDNNGGVRFSLESECGRE